MYRDRSSCDLEQPEAGAKKKKRFGQYPIPNKCKSIGGYTYSSTGEIDPHVPISRDRLWRLVQIPCGGPDDEGGRVLRSEYGGGIRRFKRILWVLKERHGKEWAVHP